MGKGCADVFGGRVRGDGFLGGGQAGYNWQLDHWVLGVETDIQGGDVKSTDVGTGPFNYVGLKFLPPLVPTPRARSFRGSEPRGAGWDWRSTVS